MNFPPSPGFCSILNIKVPFGIFFNGNVFAGCTSALLPEAIISVTLIPSGANIYAFSPFSYAILANGEE